LPADNIGQQKSVACYTKSAIFVSRKNCLILSSTMEHVLFLTIKSAIFLDIGQLCYHGDCLQWEKYLF